MKASIKKKLAVTLFALSLLINPILGFSKDTTIKTNKLESIKVLKPSESITEEKAKAAYGKLPMSFEINKGQVDDQVKFFSRSGGYTLFLTGEEAVFSLRESKDKTKVMRMQLSGNKKAEIVGEEELLGKSNYFIGNDSKKWRTDVSHYAKVRYKEVYAGIDMVYYGNQNQLEYDFIVKPGAKVEDIKLAYKGVDKITTNKEGELVLKVGTQEIKQHKPFIYQEKEGQKIEVAGNYEVKGKGVGFKIENYDLSKSLVIDPVLEYSTYLGGSNDESGNGIAVDNTGAAYVTGTTTSADFPIQYELQKYINIDIFITKLNPVGALVYSTYLGGNSDDYGNGIAVDSKGAAYVTGATISTNFPTLYEFQKDQTGQDAFVTKLNPFNPSKDLTVTMAYSTYLGANNGDYGVSIAVDNKEAAYVTGFTWSTNYPTQNEIQTDQPDRDVFVTKLNPFTGVNVTLDYSTYLGGNNDDWGGFIAVDNTGSAYVTGATASTNFLVQNEFQQDQPGEDVFVTKLNRVGSLVYSTYLGGNDDEWVDGIAIDNTGSAYVMGWTLSTRFPIKNPYQATLKGGWDAFVTKLSPNGNGLIYSTYLGGSNDEYYGGGGIAVDTTEAAYVIGTTHSTDFPTKNPVQATSAGRGDAFVTKIGGCPNITITSLAPMPDGEQCINYQALNLNATGGIGPYTFSLSNPSDLPKGLTLSLNGSISGIPLQAGTFTFTVIATDSNGCEGAQQYTINITPSIKPCDVNG